MLLFHLIGIDTNSKRGTTNGRYWRFFNRQMPAAMTSNPAGFQAIGGKFHVNITGDYTGSWFIDASASGPTCTATSYADSDGRADATITVAAEDFQMVMRDQAIFMQLLFQGKISCMGNNSLAMLAFPKLLALAAS